MTGTIWLRLGDVDFPEAGWNDFVVLILDAWVAALLQLLRGESEHAIVHFMEGPHEVHLMPDAGNRLTLVAKTRGRGPEPRQVAAAKAPLSDVAMDVVTSAEAILSLCQERFLWTVDARRLKSSVAQLRGKITKPQVDPSPTKPGRRPKRASSGNEVTAPVIRELVHLFQTRAKSLRKQGRLEVESGSDLDGDWLHVCLQRNECPDAIVEVVDDKLAHVYARSSRPADRGRVVARLEGIRIVGNPERVFEAITKTLLAVEHGVEEVELAAAWENASLREIE
jgi:hypothetical protein